MEERKMILKMIEDGKITAEEGLKLLNALQPEKEAEKEPKAEGENYLTTQVDWEKAGQSKRSYKEPSGTSFFTSFIESAFQKIKDLDFDFNFGSYVEVEHIFQHTGFTGSEIDISIENGSITFEPWSNKDVRLECKAKVYRAHNQTEARQMLLRDAIFQATEDKLKFYTKVKSIKLEIVCYVPEQLYREIKLYTFNGHIKGSRLNVNKMETKVVNGSISFEDLSVERINAETVNGPLEVRGIKGERSEFKTMNGTITVEGALLDVDVETVNGTVNYHLQEIKEPCYAELKATTGSVNIFVPAELRVEGLLKTNVGGFSCELHGLEILEEKKEFIQKSIAFIANKDASPRLKLEAETNTGSIHLVQN